MSFPQDQGPLFGSTNTILHYQTQHPGHICILAEMAVDPLIVDTLNFMAPKHLKTSYEMSSPSSGIQNSVQELVLLRSIERKLKKKSLPLLFPATQNQIPKYSNISTLLIQQQQYCICTYTFPVDLEDREGIRKTCR